MNRTHEVIDTHTGATVGRYGRKGAYRVADRMDRNHGAVRYAVRELREPVTVIEHTAFLDRLSFCNQWHKLTGCTLRGALL